MHWLLAAAALGLAVSAHAQPLSLADALKSADAQSPRLAAQRHLLSSTEAQVGRAGELPDPKLRLGIENLPVTGPDAWRYGRDSMTMGQIGVAQEFPNSAKRSALNQRAERLRDVERASLEAQRALLHRDVALAWLEAHFSDRAKAALERLAHQFRVHSETLSAAVVRGRQSAAEALTVRLALEQTNDRLIEQQRVTDRSRITLAALIGADAQRPLGDAPDLARFAYPRENITRRLAEHPELRVVEQRENLSRAEVELARSTRSTDWMLEVGYGQRRPYFDNMLSVMLSFDLPLRREQRQDRDILSKLAEVEQARAMREEALRMHTAEVRGWLADFDAAARRVERFEGLLLPLARDRRAASLAAYEGGRGEVGAVLEAERAVTETELVLVQALAEQAKAWAKLNHLYPQQGHQ
jgi:outer membrane protein, heavy metal efflux system